MPVLLVNVQPLRSSTDRRVRVLPSPIPSSSDSLLRPTPVAGSSVMSAFHRW